MNVSLSDAKAKLSKLIRAVEKGATVTICRRGVPVADLVRAHKRQGRPKFGTLRGRIVIHDPNWWKPMTDEEVDDFVEGRY